MLSRAFEAVSTVGHSRCRNDSRTRELEGDTCSGREVVIEPKKRDFLDSDKAVVFLLKINQDHVATLKENLTPEEKGST